MDNCRQKEVKKETWITVDRRKKRKKMDNCRQEEKKETWIIVNSYKCSQIIRSTSQ